MLLNLLFESAWKASIIPFGDDTTFYAMKAFGGYDMKIPFLLSVIGATAGQMFNWLIGNFIFLQRDKMKISDYWQSRITALFRQYGIFTLLFSWVPLCNLLVVIAGFANIRPKIVLMLVIVGQAFNYGYALQ